MNNEITREDVVKITVDHCKVLGREANNRLLKYFGSPTIPSHRWAAFADHARQEIALGAEWPLPTLYPPPRREPLLPGERLVPATPYVHPVPAFVANLADELAQKHFLKHPPTDDAHAERVKADIRLRLADEFKQHVVHTPITLEAAKVMWGGPLDHLGFDDGRAAFFAVWALGIVELAEAIVRERNK